MKKPFSAFTLIEILIVIVIMGILLSVTFGLWWDYINTLRYQQDRDNYMNVIDETIVVARTSNYYKDSDQKYSFLDLVLKEQSVHIYYGEGDARSTWWVASSWTEAASYTFDDEDMRVVFGSWWTEATVRLQPFVLWCNIWPSDIAAEPFPIKVRSDRYDYDTCYMIDTKVCKFREIDCSF